MPGWLQEPLGYGHHLITDLDDPSQPPAVTATVVVPASSTFTRILQGQVNNNEEVRLHFAGTFDAGFQFAALAPAGSLTSSPVWACVRCAWVSKRKTHYRFRENVVFDDIELGW